MTKQQPTCKTCQFFQKQENYAGGSCRRFPPTVIGYMIESDRNGRETSWDQATPYMQPTDWCGEHVGR